MYSLTLLNFIIQVPLPFFTLGSRREVDANFFFLTVFSPVFGQIGSEEKVMLFIYLFFIQVR